MSQVRKFLKDKKVRLVIALSILAIVLAFHKLFILWSIDMLLMYLIAMRYIIKTPQNPTT